MAMRGLGNPVAFRLTAGHRGNAPQAAPLIAGLPAQVVLADGAYDAAHFRQVIADKAATAVTPIHPSVPANILSIGTSTASAISSSAASPGSSSSAASQPASRKLPATTSPSSLSPPPSYGSGKCPQLLGIDRVFPKRLRSLRVRRKWA